MARPKKEGIEYFPFDVDFFTDDKIEPISGEFGIKGEIVAIRLLCTIYKENGYFARWDDRLKLSLSSRCKVTPELVNDIVTRLVKWEFLDKDLFNSDKILTSKGIQERFKEATRKRKTDYSKLKYWILGVSGAHNPPITPLQEGFLPPETTQRESERESDSKSKDTKVEYYGSDPLPPPPQIIESPFSDQFYQRDVDSLKVDYFTSAHQAERERVQQRLGCQENELKFIMLAFIGGLTSDQRSKSMKDFKNHFWNWARKNIQDLGREIKDLVSEGIRIHKGQKLSDEKPKQSTIDPRIAAKLTG